MPAQLGKGALGRAGTAARALGHSSAPWAEVAPQALALRSRRRHRQGARRPQLGIKVLNHMETD